MGEAGERRGAGDVRILLSVGLGTLMSALDASVVNTVLPVIRASFSAAVDSIQWVVTVYLLVMGGLLLTFGRLGDLRGHRRVFLLGFGVFLPASVLCGIAPGEGVLIAARTVQGIGAALLVSNSAAILVRGVHPSRIGRALGLMAAMTYLGLTVGPSLGGFLADAFGWRSIFFINVPIGAAAFALGLRRIPPDRPSPEAGERFDHAGAALFSGAFLALLLALNRGSAWGWASAGTVGTFAACGALGILFVRREKRAPSPMLDLSIFRDRLFAMAVGSSLVNYVCVASVLFLAPFFFIEGRGLSPARAGLLMTAQSLAMVVTSPLSGFAADRVGSRVPATVGMALLAAGLFLLASLDGGSSLALAAAALMTTGVGNAIFVTPNNSAMLGAAPRGRQGIASGIMATSRLVGLATGVGLSGAILAGVVGAHPGQAIPDGRLFPAVHAGFFTTGALAVCGTFFTAARGNRVPPGDTGGQGAVSPETQR